MNSHEELIEEAESWVAHTKQSVVGAILRDMISALESVRAERDAALAALERVRAQHRVDQYTEGRVVTRCVCEEKWPCSTMAALAPVTEEGDRDAATHQ